MYSVKVHSNINDTTRYLNFETYNTAANCYRTLRSTKETSFYPEDYFEAAVITDQPIKEVLNEIAVETDFVITYIYKTVKKY